MIAQATLLPPLPRLRSDLATSRQTTADGAIFVVKDPLREKFYRFPEEAHFIADQLDGTTPLEVVRQRTEAHFQTALPPEQLNAFVRQLDTAGLLENEKNKPGGTTPPRRPRRVAGNLLSLRIRFLDPDRLFNFLIDKVRFFFTPQFLVVAAVLIALAVNVAVTNWDDITQNVSRLYQLSSIPLVLGVIFLVIGAHEFAHGLTCKHFGGEVHELGFLLIYLQPALYCNVSDAWLFPEKAKRLWVGFAGPFFELFLWAVATLVWRLTDVETDINFIAYVVMTSSGLKTLLNFNPFIKLDGYYLLSDWLEVPNLRARSFAMAGRGFKRFFGLDVPPPPPVRRTEWLACLAYGSVAVTASFGILGYAVAQLGDYFLSQSQPLGFAAILGLLGLKLRRRFRRLFRPKTGVTANPDDDDVAVAEADEPAAAAAPTPPASTPPPPAPPTPAPHVPAPRKKKSRAGFRWFLFSLLAVTAAVFAIFVPWQLKIGGPFEILPLHNADVRSQIEALVEEIRVNEGDTIRAGDLVAKLADRDARAELQKNAADLAQARGKLQMLEAGPKREEIQVAQATVTKDEAALQFARNQLARYQPLLDKGLLSEKEFEDAQAAMKTAEGELGEATSQLKLLQSGNRPETIEAARTDVARLEDQRRYLEEQFQLLSVKSPATGIVATPQRDLEAMRHQLVKKGDLIAKVYELHTVTAEIGVSERDIADIHIGHRVVLKVRAYPELTFFGKVTSIATTAQSTSGANSAASTVQPAVSTRNSTSPKMVIITTEIENPDLLLKPEMTGQAKIFCGDRRIVDLLVRRIARTVRVEFWSWW